MKRRHTIEAQNQKLRLALHAFSWRENGLFTSYRTISVKKTEETHAVLSSQRNPRKLDRYRKEDRNGQMASSLAG